MCEGLLGKKIIKEIRDGTWKHLVNKHNLDVDTISKELRCVEREGVLNGGEPVTFLRLSAATTSTGHPNRMV